MKPIEKGLNKKEDRNEVLDDAPFVELSFFLGRERFRSLMNLAENQQITVAQIVRSMIEREMDQAGVTL
ncbi:MAG: hypothetical protein RJA81_2202 [Planctomycetota bacterium]|jgi:hypothetical protein